jgi:hypothetical protein
LWCVNQWPVPMRRRVDQCRRGWTGIIVEWSPSRSHKVRGRNWGTPPGLMRHPLKASRRLLRKRELSSLHSPSCSTGALRPYTSTSIPGSWFGGSRCNKPSDRRTAAPALSARRCPSRQSRHCVHPARLNSALVCKTEQTRLPEYCSIDMWCRFLETAHELGGDAERPRLSLFNSSTDQGGGKRNRGRQLRRPIRRLRRSFGLPIGRHCRRCIGRCRKQGFRQNEVAQ